MKGVKKVVKVGDTAVAVVADTFWHAKTALDALPIVWDEGENAKVSSASIAKWLSEGLEGGPAYVGNSNGDVNTALAGAVKKVEAVAIEDALGSASLGDFPHESSGSSIWK